MTQVYRCTHCAATLAVGNIERGVIQIKCRRCKHTTLITVQQPQAKAAA